MRSRRSPPATPLRNGIAVAGITFVGPVAIGMISGDLTLRGFGLIVLLTLAGFLLGYGATLFSERNRHHRT
ncbi:MAG: hypothetical protein JWO76_470 [Nocardioides sp.]|nr:hypothetical protein [Nocardioides sp.]